MALEDLRKISFINRMIALSMITLGALLYTTNNLHNIDKHKIVSDVLDLNTSFSGVETRIGENRIS
jgi:hypothetical protein